MALDYAKEKFEIWRSIAQDRAERISQLKRERSEAYAQRNEARADAERYWAEQSKARAEIERLRAELAKRELAELV